LNQNVSQHTKFHQNRMIPGRDIAMKLFEKWRLSAILSIRKLLIWSLDLCLNMIMLQRRLPNFALIKQ